MDLSNNHFMEEFSMQKPNIVFFFTDDQRFDTINALGNTEIATPNIDYLINNGTAFTQAHIPGGTCAAVCMPSRAMLHTGRSLFHIEGEGQTIPENHKTIGETMKESGYKTFGTGKWHNGTVSYARSFTDGDEIFFGGMEDHWNVPANHYDPEGKYDKRAKKARNCFLSNAVVESSCDHVTPGKHSSELFCDAAIHFLNKYDEANPFFMYISFMAPHDPRTMPDEFLKMYDPDKIKLPPNYMDTHPFKYGVEGIRDELLAAYPRSQKEIRRHMAEYYAMITHLDHEMGRVIETIKQKGQLDNTIFVFAGDNGLAVGQHGLMGKQSHYEHSIRVPLVFCGPGIKKGHKQNSYVYLMDIFPTLCEMTEIQVPDSVEGKSLVSIMDDPDKTIRDSLYFAYHDLIRSVKDKKYKLIEYASQSLRKTQLFDLENDPWELNDLSSNNEYESTINALREMLYHCRDEWEDIKHDSGKKFWGRFLL
jgi:arylsulfatase A-like enzyme